MLTYSSKDKCEILSCRKTFHTILYNNGRVATPENFKLTLRSNEFEKMRNLSNGES